jgi:RNA polymerase primary sigma factor
MQTAATRRRVPTRHTRPRSGDDRLVRDRVLRVLRTEMDFISNKSFRTTDREFERRVLEDRYQVTRPESTVPRTLPAHLARLCEAGMLTPEEERELFRRMNYLKYRANVLRSRLSPHAPDEAMLEKVERFLAAAHAIRDQIIKANMRLVISVVKKFVTPQHSFDDMLSDGIYSLMQAVDKFDFDRGFRFSTYAYRAIARNAYRAIMKQQKDTVRLASELDELNLDGSSVRSEPSMDIKTWTRLRSLLGQVMEQLDRRERLIIRCRYALGGHRKVKTFQAIAERLGVSKERVRQLEQRAMTKLRSTAAELNMEEVLEPSLTYVP